MRFRHTVTVHRSIDEVFAFVTGLENFSIWMANLVRAEHIARQPVGVGSGIDGERALPPQHHGVPAEVIAFEPPRVFAWRSTTGPTPVTMRFTLEACPQGTTLTMTEHVEAPSHLVAEWAGKQAEADILAVKALLERDNSRRTP